MNRYFLFVLFLLLFSTTYVCANNVKIVGDVKVNSNEIVNNKIATIRFTVEWENSWRDEFNHDAVYLFLKYKVDGDTEPWYHLHPQKDGSDGMHVHTIGNGFDYTLLDPGATNGAVGMMLYRNENNKTYGKSQVTVELKWDFTAGLRPVQRIDLEAGKVYVSAMAIEMVYVPSGAYRIGDGRSSKGFVHNYMPLPEKYDVVTDQYWIKSTGGVGNPYLIASRRNDIYTAAGARTSTSNMWIGATAPDYLRIDFGLTRDSMPTGQKKKITWFAIEGHPSYVPNVWRLQGDVEGSGQWTTLYEGKEGDWCVDMLRTYPATRALKIPNPVACRGYRIAVESMKTGAAPAIKTLAMSEVDLATVVDSSVLVWQSASYINTTPVTGKIYTEVMSASDGENWALNTTTSGQYPNGVQGFYAMKYEITQEQYVAFLNKLTYAQQKQRTIGQGLDLYQVGEYIFGPDKTKPNSRNGIILASRPANRTYPVMFANNLNPATEYAQDGDGQTLACNYLSAGDMLCYADWCGLRPMTELEYEKMGRRPYPFVPQRGEYAWNTTKFTAPTKITAGTEGKQTEKADGNANADGKLGGPVRVGSFAKGATGQEAAGASFWGIMDLSGNLAEIYYNVNTEGRKFYGYGSAYHGNGVIDANGFTDMSTSYWPTHVDAFALRGGHYASKSKELAVSDRSRALGVYQAVTTIEQKDSVATFRLGWMAPAKGPGVSTLLLANGRTDMDTTCSGAEYTITGNLPAPQGAYTFVWFRSDNQNERWEEIEGENSQDLTLSNLYNDGTARDVFTEVWFKRVMYTGRGYSNSPVVKLKVVNHRSVLFSRNQDTLDYYGWMKGTNVRAYTYQPAEITWFWRGKEIDPHYDTKRMNSVYNEYFVPEYNDFRGADGKIHSGVQEVIVEVVTMKYCMYRDTLQLYVKPEPPVQPSREVTCGNYMQDVRDKKIYPTVMIGSQCWMAKNLDYALTGSKCQFDDGAYCEIYGRLYTYEQGKLNGFPQGICPDGWHMPSIADFNEVWAAAGSSWSNIRSGSNLWGTSGYQAPTNNTRFSALPGGYYNNGKIGTAGYWGTVDNTYYGLDNTTWSGSTNYWTTSGRYYSVRCVKSEVEQTTKKLVQRAGGYIWSDGSMAISGLEYFKSTENPPTGWYWIDSDGYGGEESYLAYCDMTTDGGGWTRFDEVINGWHGCNNGYKDRVTNLNRFRNLATVSREQKMTNLQGSVYNTNSYYGWVNYNNSCISSITGCWTNSTQGGKDVVVEINGNWLAAMYKSYFYCYNTANGPYFYRMWFR